MSRPCTGRQALPDVDRATYVTTSAKLEDIARRLQAQATGSDTVAMLRGPLRTPDTEALLIACRIMRDAGKDMDDIIASLVMMIAEDHVFDAAQTGDLKGISDRMQALRTAHGLDHDEDWGLGEGPEDYQALSTEWECSADRIIAATFRAYGEHEMAVLFLDNQVEFWRRFWVAEDAID